MNNLSNLPPGVSVFDEHINPRDLPEFEDTALDTWFERDRQYVGLFLSTESEYPQDGQLLLEYWDEDVSELVDDGFLDPQDWHRSLYDYFIYLNK